MVVIVRLYGGDGGYGGFVWLVCMVVIVRLYGGDGGSVWWVCMVGLYGGESSIICLELADLFVNLNTIW